MPKKQIRNAYYFFMIDFREEQKKKGIHYENLKDVQVAADPAWRQIHPAQRAKYEAMAKKEKERLRGHPEQKFTSNGISYAQIDNANREIQEMIEQELAYIKNFVSQKKIDNMLLEEDIFVIDVNSYCFAGTHYFMAESAILRFNIVDGIKDIYFENIHPGLIPTGYAADVKQGAQMLGLDMPDDDRSQFTDYLKVLATVMDYLKDQSGGKSIPPMYTLPDKVEQVQGFIRQLCVRASEDDSAIRVYRLDTLFYHMVNAISTAFEDKYPQPTLATAQLRKDPFKYTPGLACEPHEETDKAVECSRSRVQRWAFTVLDKCCLVAGVQPVQGRHLPRDTDIMGVLAFRDEKKKEISQAGPGAVGLPAQWDERKRGTGRAGSSTATSVCSNNASTYETASCSWVDKGKQLDTARNPMRMPKTDYSKTVAVAPELSVDDSNFPKLGGAGRGRGFPRK